MSRTNVVLDDELVEECQKLTGNGKGKPYQVKQVRDVILRYNLRLED